MFPDGGRRYPRRLRRALRESHRVLKAGGWLLLVLPDCLRTFDHARPVTSLAHLVEDFERGTAEDDQSRVEEALALQVFDHALAVAAVQQAGFRVLASERVLPFHVVVFATKLTAVPPAR
jgi:hypothetical protein